MKVHFYDPAPHANEYLTQMFFGPLRQFLPRKGDSIHDVTDLAEVRNGLILTAGDHLSHERIEAIKNNGNKLVSFDINDSSFISGTYANSPNKTLIDIIFKVSGVPFQNEVVDVSLGPNFEIVTTNEKFLPDEKWAKFDGMRQQGRIKPLPYTLWRPLVGQNYYNRPYANRSKKVLTRGGNHFWRVILAFRLMQDGLLDQRSQFATADYFRPTMEQRFRYCDSCIAEKQQHGRAIYDAPARGEECLSTAAGWHKEGGMIGGPAFGRSILGLWNNRCPHSFYQLAKEFEKHRGPLDHPFLEKLLNGDMQHENDFTEDLAQATYYGDLKWANTINLPPRFWEAASVGTVSLYTKRTANQDYWPKVQENVHYLTYPEDMKNFGLSEVSEQHWNSMSRAVKDLYETKIRGTEFTISNSLLEYMYQSIKDAAASAL